MYHHKVFVLFICRCEFNATKRCVFQLLLYMKYVPCKIGIRRSFVSMWLLMQDIKVTTILRKSSYSYNYYLRTKKNISKIKRTTASVAISYKPTLTSCSTFGDAKIINYYKNSLRCTEESYYIP